MEPEGTTEVIASAQAFWQEITRLLPRLFQTWTLYQIIIILVITGLSILLTRAFRPKIADKIDQIGGQSRNALRIAKDIKRRLPLYIYVIIGFSVVTIMQIATWPSRSFFISLTVEIAFVWLVISIVSTLIKNRSIRFLVVWLGWIIATLHMTGFLDLTKALLDSLALEIGSTRISVLTVLIEIFSLLALFIIATLISKAASKRIHRIDDMSPSIKVLISKTLQISLYTAAFLMSLKAVGFHLGNVAVLSGAIGLGIGFGLQKIVSNLISGVIILLDKSIKPGDVISLNETFGWITQLGARYASVTTRDGHEHLIPNEDFITSQVINWSHSSDFVRLDIFFGVDYDSDPHQVRMVAAEAPLVVDRVVINPSPVCHIVNFGDSSIDFILRFWIRDPNKGLTNIRGNVYLALWDALKEHNINIPYPRREVTVLGTRDAEIISSKTTSVPD